MAKSDALKESIGWLKVVFGIFALSDLSLLAWLAQNYERGDVLVLGGGTAAVGLSGFVLWLHKKAQRVIKELEGA